ncbi:hypothetical protein H9P43_004298 [Blastocladiella emersonii ATCC 22665]|nr:hypothetical protein H9P43_004298 [Blastocladiella emersonii ATCC 22665]
MSSSTTHDRHAEWPGLAEELAVFDEDDGHTHDPTHAPPPAPHDFFSASPRPASTPAPPALSQSAAAGMLWTSLLHAACRFPARQAGTPLLLTLQRGLDAVREAVDTTGPAPLPGQDDDPATGPRSALPVLLQSVLVLVEHRTLAGNAVAWTNILASLLALAGMRRLWRNQLRLAELNASWASTVATQLDECGPSPCVLPALYAVLSYYEHGSGNVPRHLLLSILAGLPRCSDDTMFALFAIALRLIVFSPVLDDKPHFLRAATIALFHRHTARCNAWTGVRSALLALALHAVDPKTHDLWVLDAVLHVLVDPSSDPLTPHETAEIAAFVLDLARTLGDYHVQHAPVLADETVFEWLATVAKTASSAAVVATAVQAAGYLQRAQANMQQERVWGVLLAIPKAWWWSDPETVAAAALGVVRSRTCIEQVVKHARPILDLLATSRHRATRTAFLAWSAAQLADPTSVPLARYLAALPGRTFSRTERESLAAAAHPSLALFNAELTASSGFSSATASSPTTPLRSGSTVVVSQAGSVTAAASSAVSVPETWDALLLLVLAADNDDAAPSRPRWPPPRYESLGGVETLRGPRITGAATVRTTGEGVTAAEFASLAHDGEASVLVAARRAAGGGSDAQGHAAAGSPTLSDAEVLERIPVRD